MKSNKFVIKLERPHCRTPIKPVQVHKRVVINGRKEKHKRNLSHFHYAGE